MNKTRGAADRLAWIMIHYGPLVIILGFAAIMFIGVWSLGYLFG